MMLLFFVVVVVDDVAVVVVVGSSLVAQTGRQLPSVQTVSWLDIFFGATTWRRCEGGHPCVAMRVVVAK